jgi:hypothetical protein
MSVLLNNGRWSSDFSHIDFSAGTMIASSASTSAGAEEVLSMLDSSFACGLFANQSANSFVL